MDELNHQLDRKATLAKEGQEKLRTIKASVIEAIELNREKLKRLLKQLKEHEKDVIAMRDVKLKEAAVNEYNRATTSIEEKLVQVGTLSYYHSLSVTLTQSQSHSVSPMNTITACSLSLFTVLSLLTTFNLLYDRSFGSTSYLHPY